MQAEQASCSAICRPAPADPPGRLQVGGQKLYEAARKGKEVERTPRTVTGAARGARPALRELPCQAQPWEQAHRQLHRPDKPSNPSSLCPVNLARWPRQCQKRCHWPPPPPPPPPAVDRFDLWRDEIDAQNVHFRVVCSKARAGVVQSAVAVVLPLQLPRALWRVPPGLPCLSNVGARGAWGLQDLQAFHIFLLGRSESPTVSGPGATFITAC